MNMIIQQKIKDLENQIEALKAQEHVAYDWNKAPVICELNGYRWHLGPEADEEMSWQDAIKWCELVGGELPPRDILLQCYMNDDKPFFKKEWYWSSTEFDATDAWVQGFTNGNQYSYTKTSNTYVRAVRKCPI